MKAFGMILTAVGIALAIAGGSMLDSATLWIPVLTIGFGAGMAIPGILILRRYEDEIF